MAKDKKSVLVYAEWRELFSTLSYDEAGKLIKHFFDYINDMNPVAGDRITELSFIPIKQCLKRDLQKWEQRADKSRENGKLGGRPLVNNTTKETNQVIIEPKEPVKENVNVNVNVNGNEEKENTKASVDFLYEIYPSKCPVKNVSTGKGQSCKDKISSLLKSKTKEEIEISILHYLSEQKKALRYIMNFKTLLNNLPDAFSKPTQNTEIDKLKYRWKDEGNQIIRHIDKGNADKYFANMEQGGYIPVML